MTRSRVIPSIALLLVAAGIALALTGVSLLPLIAVATIIWLGIFASRWGGGLGLAASLLGAALLVLVSIVAFPLIGAQLLPSSVVVWGLAGAAGAVVMMRSARPAAVRDWRGAACMWLPPMFGAAIWTVTMLGSAAVESVSRYSWVMMGDSANNLLFARETIYNDGIGLGGDSNPVPLPSAFIALAMSAGRSSTTPVDLLRHDISSFALVWALLIAVTCYLAGVAAAIVIDRGRRWLVAVAGAGASVIPLTWFVTGYPLEYGFFNTHLALPIVFLAWIAAVTARRRPPIAFASLLVACTLTLAVWSPLVLIPLLLAVLVLVRNWRALLATRGLPLVVVAAAAAQLLVYGLVSTLPTLLAQGGFLTGVGGVIPFPRLVLVTAVVGATAAAALALVRRRTETALALAAVLVAGLLGIGALLFLNRAQPSPWTYYPTKLAWLMTIVFCVLAVGVVLAELPRLRSLLLGIVATVLAVLAIGAAYSVARSIPAYAWRDPIPRILTDDFASTDAVAERIFALSDPENPTLLWHSDDPAEGTINFWLLQMRADSTSERRALREYAYGHGDGIDDLCEIVHAMGAPVTVYTADATLESELSATCPGTATVIVEKP